MSETETTGTETLTGVSKKILADLRQEPINIRERVAKHLTPNQGSIPLAFLTAMFPKESPKGREHVFPEKGLGILFKALLMLLLTEQVEKLERYFDSEGNWAISKIPLEQIQNSPHTILLQTLFRNYGDFQDFANVWPVIGQDGSMNDHGQTHIKEVATSLVGLISDADIVPRRYFSPQVASVSLAVGASVEHPFELPLPFDLSKDLAIRALVVAAFFHDTGMAFGGRKDHEKNSVEFLRATITGWDSRIPFCAEVERLILFHVTSAIHLETFVKQQDWRLALLVLCDETQIHNRVNNVGRQLENYESDPWVRIAADVTFSELVVDKANKKIIWQIFSRVGDGEGQITIDKRNKKLLSAIRSQILKLKHPLLLACVKNILGPEATFTIVFNDGEVPLSQPTPSRKKK